MKKYQLLLAIGLLIVSLLAGCSTPDNFPSSALSTDSAVSIEEKAASSPPSSKAPATITITLSVDCKTAVDYGSELAASISSNGVLLSDRKLTLEKDATVYDALKNCGLVIGAHSSSMGQYIYSIQSLQEKACGGKSGWMCFVNGSYISQSCSSYTLKDGDSVQWRYTCNNGKDL